MEAMAEPEAEAVAAAVAFAATAAREMITPAAEEEAFAPLVETLFLAVDLAAAVADFLPRAAMPETRATAMSVPAKLRARVALEDITERVPLPVATAATAWLSCFIRWRGDI